MTSPRHPIHRIPPELLSNILYQHTPSSYSAPNERYDILAPSHVCQHWRSIALSTPALWTFILFACPEDEDRIRESNCAQAWLLRSGQCALACHVEARTRKSAKAALQILIPHCMRWREFATDLLVPIKSRKLSQLKGKLPILESADLCYDDANAFMIAPRLRRLALYTLNDPNHPLLHNLANIQAPWIQLIHLEIETFDTPVLARILASASNLLSCHLLSCSVPVQNRHGHFSNVEPKIVKHSSLEKFGVSSDFDDASVNFMDCLVLPALRKLIVFKPWRAAVSLVARSECTLVSLQIHTFTTFECSELLKIAPSLEELLVRCYRLDDWGAIVESLIIHGDTQLVSKLRSLDMHLLIGPIESIDMTRFADMIESRWVPGNLPLDFSRVSSTLNHVQVIFSFGIVILDPSRARLRKFVQNGLGLALLVGHSMHQPLVL